MWFTLYFRNTLLFISFSCTLLAAVYLAYLRHLKVIDAELSGTQILYSLRSRHRCFGGEAKKELSKTRARTRGEMKRSCSPRALYKHLPKTLSPNHQANPCKSPMYELLVYVGEFDRIYPCQAKLAKTSLMPQ